MKTFQNMPRHLENIINKNQDWKAHLIDNQLMDRFMYESFANTSVLWAYEKINPELGAVKADIWRMAVLWMNGGVYIDSDATVHQSFDRVRNHCLFVYQQ